MAPPPDPGLAVLQQQTEQQNIAAQSRDAASQTARISRLYGSLTGGPNNFLPLSGLPTGAAPAAAPAPAQSPFGNMIAGGAFRSLAGAGLT